ncbi:hypothetical protein Tco_1234676 [Tanacetum coccineum]
MQAQTATFEKSGTFLQGSIDHPKKEIKPTITRNSRRSGIRGKHQQFHRFVSSDGLEVDMTGVVIRQQEGALICTVMAFSSFKPDYRRTPTLSFLRPYLGGPVTILTTIDLHRQNLKVQQSKGYGQPFSQIQRFSMNEDTKPTMKIAISTKRLSVGWRKNKHLNIHIDPKYALLEADFKIC